MLSTTGLPPETKAMLKDHGMKDVGLTARCARLLTLYAEYRLDDLPTMESDFFVADQVRETFKDTMFDGEHHRMLTPWLQALWSQERQEFLRRLDSTSVASTENYLNMIAQRFNFAIIGSGPHGSAFAANIREKYPKATICLIESSERLGGQWRSYGPKPSYVMNSRVRRANRRLPALPGTEGSINPVGRFAPLELSDVVSTQYATNLDMGDVVAINGYLSADQVLVGANATRIRTQVVDGKIGERTFTVTADVVVDARGMYDMRPALRTKDDVKASGVYMTGRDFYKHLATQKMPLQMFDGRKVIVVGAGDSANTVIEAMLGTLPAESYGQLGAGRFRPKEIVWFGVQQDDPDEIIQCLRSRYKNGISQALKGNASLITPRSVNILEVNVDGMIGFVRDNNVGRWEFGDFIIDCTTQRDGRDSGARVSIGPNAVSLPARITSEIQRLKIPANNVSLWATMPETDRLSLAWGEELVKTEVMAK